MRAIGGKPIETGEIVFLRERSSTGSSARPFKIQAGFQL
jgi:hypothetical protein